MSANHLEWWQTFCVDLAVIDQLAHPDTHALLASLPPYREADAMALSTQLRAAGHSPEFTAALLTQHSLRAPALAKLGPRADGMILTPDGLEQATRGVVADRHSATFTAAGVYSVYDAGCGIASDSMAFAAAGLGVDAVDLDPLRVAIAQHNLQRFPQARARVADILTDSPGELDGFWADPARRVGGRRIKNPADWLPSLPAVLDLVARHSPTLAGIKVAPGVSYSDLPDNAGVEWTSVDGDLLEATLWMGAGVTPGRKATVIRSGKASSYTLDLDPTSPPDFADALASEAELGRYLLEPDPAVIRAGAIAQLCREGGYQPVSPGIAYLSADAAGEGEWFEAFDVVDILPAQVKALRTEMRRRGIGRLEIKKRGSDIDPARLRRELRLAGSEGAVLIMTPIAGRHRAVLAQRVD